MAWRPGLLHGSWCEGSPVNPLAAQYGPVPTGWDALEVEQGSEAPLPCCASLFLLPWCVLVVLLHIGLKRGKPLEFRASLNKFYTIAWITFIRILRCIIRQVENAKDTHVA